MIVNALKQLLNGRGCEKLFAGIPSIGALEKDMLYSERKSTKAHTVRCSQLIELCMSWYRFGNGCNNPVGLIL